MKIFNELDVNHFLDMMYVVLVNNFHVADTNMVMTAWIISTSSAQKHLIPSF